MKKPGNTNSEFYKKWSVQREYKWKYIFVHGSVLWGISVSITIMLGEKIFGSESRTLSSAIIMIAFFMAAGLFVGNSQFKQKEKLFEGLVAAEQLIGEGATILEVEKEWSHENLTFTLADNQTVLVRNKLFWLSDNQPTSTQVDDCMVSMSEDVTRFRENKIFGKFLENKKIKLQLYNNEDKIHPIAEKTL